MIKSFFIILLFVVSFAHLDGGEDKVVGEYLIDFGHSPKNIEAGQKAILAFNLVNESTRTVIDPDNVWIRISKGDEIVFAGTFYPESEHVAFTYTFPSSGNYEITSRFRDVDNTLVQTDFNVNVTGNEILFFYGGGMLVLLIIIFIISVLIRKK